MIVVCPHCSEEFEFLPPSVGADTPMRRARRAKGLTVKAAANMIGISEWTLQRMERGQGDPRIQIVHKITELYGQPADVLFPPTEGEDEDEFEEPNGEEIDD